MPKPLVQALLLANHVYQDKETGKKAIAGTFNSLSISKSKAPPKEPEPGAAGRGAPESDPKHPAAARRDPAAVEAGHGPQGAGEHPTAGAAAGRGGRRERPGESPPPVVAGRGQPPGKPDRLHQPDRHPRATDLELHYVDLSDQNVLMMLKFRVFSDDPLKTVEAILPVPPLPTPHPGVYVLELVCDGEPLGSLRITAIEVPPPS